MDFRTTGALDVVGAMAASDSIDDVIGLLRDYGGRLGYGCFCLSEIPPDHTYTSHYFEEFPAGWSDVYIEHSFYRADPVRHALINAIEPFRWSDLPASPDGSPAARVMREAAEGWRMRDGLAMPIHSVTGAQAGVSFVADRPDVNREDDGGLHLAAIFAHFRIEELSGRPTAPPAPHLSMRQRDMLLYAAAGHANGAIAEKLNLGRREARAHLVAAARKLGARTRAQAIVHASRAGLLAL